MSRRSPVAPFPLLACLLVACGGGGGGGRGAGGLVLEEISWGRLADVRDVDGTLAAKGLLVRGDLPADFLTYETEEIPVVGGTVIRILAPLGSAPFDAAFAALDATLGFVVPKSVESPPPYTMVPRNAAIRLRFNQALDSASVSPQTVRVFAGVPAQTQLEVDLRVDGNDARALLVVPTVSATRAEATGLPVNALGLPAAATAAIANLQVRVPTRRDLATGQATLLRGLSGSHPEDDDPSDGPDLVRVFRSGGESAATGDPNNGFLPDLVAPRLLAVRAGSVCAATAAGDGSQEVSLGFPTPDCALAARVGAVLRQGPALAFVAAVLPGLGACAPGLTPVARVLVDPLTEDADGVPNAIEPGPVEAFLPFEPQDAPFAACFGGFVPEPVSPPAGGIDPAAIVRVRFTEPMDPASMSAFDAVAMTRVDPGDLGPGSVAPREFVVGDLVPSGDFREFTFVPTVPIPHVLGVAETRWLTVAAGPAGPRDLAGNTLLGGAVAIPFSMQADAPDAATAGFALRFDAVNETGFDLGPPDSGGIPPSPEGGDPDYGGQVVFVPGELRGRSVARFSKAADLANPFVGGAPVQWPGAIVTPLTSMGSRLMTTIRHNDLGLGGAEINEINLTVERLSWAPAQVAAPPGGSVVVADTLPRLRIDLGHSYHFPDEWVNEALLPNYPQSGLDATRFVGAIAPTAANPAGQLSNVFAQWHWDPEMNGGAGGVRVGGLAQVYDGVYAINPLDLFVVPGSNAAMMPYPAFTQTYTWRDTGLPFARKGGPNGDGVEPRRWEQVMGTGRPRLYAAGQVPSVCLPLLMQFRSYPPNSALNANGLQVALMNNTNAQGQPSFRVFSTGGVNVGGQLVLRDPDANTPLGGFNPGSNPPGQPTLPQGTELYWGQADFVVRVTRSFTHWFDLGPPLTSNGPTFAPPSIEPRGQSVAPGTSVIVEFRGANGVAGTCATLPPTCDELTDASRANAYGVFLNQTTGAPPPQAPTTRMTGVVPPFASTPAQAAVLPEWTADLSRLNGRRYLQGRFTFVSDPASGAVARLSSLGVAYLR